MDIHNYDRKYHAALRNVEQAAISPKNKELILLFANDIVLQGLTKSRMIRYLSVLKIVAELLKKDFEEANVDDIKKIVSNVQQRADYTFWDKKH